MNTSISYLHLHNLLSPGTVLGVAYAGKQSYSVEKSTFTQSASSYISTRLSCNIHTIHTVFSKFITTCVDLSSSPQPSNIYHTSQKISSGVTVKFENSLFTDFSSQAIAIQVEHSDAIVKVEGCQFLSLNTPEVHSAIYISQCNICEFTFTCFENCVSNGAAAFAFNSHHSPLVKHVYLNNTYEFHCGTDSNFYSSWVGGYEECRVYNVNVTASRSNSLRAGICFVPSPPNILFTGFIHVEKCIGPGAFSVWDAGRPMRIDKVNIVNNTLTENGGMFEMLTSVYTDLYDFNIVLLGITNWFNQHCTFNTEYVLRIHNSHIAGTFMPITNNVAKYECINVENPVLHHISQIKDGLCQNEFPTQSFTAAAFVSADLQPFLIYLLLAF